LKFNLLKNDVFCFGTKLDGQIGVGDVGCMGIGSDPGGAPGGTPTLTGMLFPVLTHSTGSTDDSPAGAPLGNVTL
jgi:hypothetical protein